MQPVWEQVGHQEIAQRESRLGRWNYLLITLLVRSGSERRYSQGMSTLGRGRGLGGKVSWGGAGVRACSPGRKETGRPGSSQGQEL